MLDWTNREERESGKLIPVLREWDSPDASPVVLSYRPSVRRVARARIFNGFPIHRLSRDRRLGPKLAR